MASREDNQQQTGNGLGEKLATNPDWQVGAVVVTGLALLALKLFLGL